MADALGAERIAAGLARHAQQRGDPHGYWTPSALLRRLRDEQRRFADWPAA
jgi:hypothetical protein